jgi:hypothetical protein
MIGQTFPHGVLTKSLAHFPIFACRRKVLAYAFDFLLSGSSSPIDESGNGPLRRFPRPRESGRPKLRSSFE